MSRLMPPRCGACTRRHYANVTCAQARPVGALSDERRAEILAAIERGLERRMERER